MVNIPRTKNGKPVNERFAQIEKMVRYYKFTDTELKFLEKECQLYRENEEKKKVEREKAKKEKQEKANKEKEIYRGGL